MSELITFFLAVVFAGLTAKGVALFWCAETGRNKKGAILC